MKCFILAGGFATRLWPLTERRAKPLLPLKGKPIITHLVEHLPPEIPIVVSTNAVFADDFKRWAKTMRGRPIEILTEDTGHDDQKLGALGAVAQWLTEAKIEEDIVLLAGDNYVGFSLQALVQAYRGTPLLAACDVGSPEKAKRFGTIVVDEGNPAAGTPPARTTRSDGESQLRFVKDFEEKPASPRSSFVSTGCSVLPRTVFPIVIEFAKQRPDNIGGIFEELLKRKVPIECMVFHERWEDIGSFEAYMSIHCELVGTEPIVDPSAIVDAKSKFLGSVAIGPQVTVTESTLTDCILFGESTIENCILDRCIVDTRCTLSGIDLTEKMLRRGTILKK